MLVAARIRSCGASYSTARVAHSKAVELPRSLSNVVVCCCNVFVLVQVEFAFDSASGELAALADLNASSAVAPGPAVTCEPT